MTESLFWAPRAWLPGGWRDSVLLEMGRDGHWVAVTPDVAPPAQATVLTGPVLPGLVDAHSHAFQRAFAGLAERRESEHDDFWSWRDRMYRLALRITPEQLRASGRPLISAGLAIHSLRAAAPASIARLTESAGEGPIHIHIAEQTQEVDDCLAVTGQRPIEWLVANASLDARWQLVHATHSTSSEIDAVARSGAGVVLCPATEANLGDGLADVPGWLAAGVPISIGSDSQVTRAWPEELRLLEYGQR